MIEYQGFHIIDIDTTDIISYPNQRSIVFIQIFFILYLLVDIPVLIIKQDILEPVPGCCLLYTSKTVPDDGDHPLPIPQVQIADHDGNAHLRTAGGKYI